MAVIVTVNGRPNGVYQSFARALWVYDPFYCGSHRLWTSGLLVSYFVG